MKTYQYSTFEFLKIGKQENFFSKSWGQSRTTFQNKKAACQRRTDNTYCLLCLGSKRVVNLGIIYK